CQFGDQGAQGEVVGGVGYGVHPFGAAEAAGGAACFGDGGADGDVGGVGEGFGFQGVEGGARDGGVLQCGAEGLALREQDRVVGVGARGGVLGDRGLGGGGALGDDARAGASL